jgi:hypothetical protein
MRFELYRYTHPDGTAKEWAYADLGTGQAEIRWGPANQLRNSQIKPLREAWDRALQKVRKGYVKVGLVMLDDQGSRVTPRPRRFPPKPAPDLATLLGSEDDGFYF